MHTPVFTDVVSCAEIAAAAAIMNQNGYDVKLPWIDDLDAINRLQYETLVKALMAAISVRANPHSIARYTANVLANGSAVLGDDGRLKDWASGEKNGAGGSPMPPRPARSIRFSSEQPMPEINQYTFKQQELIAALIQYAGIEQGRWQLVVEFTMGATNAGPNAAEFIPTAMVGIKSFNLQKATPESPAVLVVDAADATLHKRESI